MSEELTQKLNEINNIKGQIKTSMINKGLAVTDETPFREYPTAIDNMSSGGEKIFANYVDSEITEGKKVLLTKVTNPVTPDSEFCNGFIPFIISNGLAYGWVMQSISASSSYAAKSSPIADGMINSNIQKSIGSIEWGSSDYVQIRHFCNGGKNGVSLFYNSENDGYMNNIANWCNGVRSKSSIAYQRKRAFLTEHYIISTSPYVYYSSHTGIDAFKFNDDSVERIDITNSDINSGYRHISGFQGFIFEREEDNGCVYWIRSKSATDFNEVVFEKYVFETGTFETLTTPYFEGNALSDIKTRFFQTKDYKYIIHKNGYVFLNYFNTLTSPNADGIIIKEFPEQIKTAMGDRTVTGIQVFYDGYFALMLNDGTTLMCCVRETLLNQEQEGIVSANGGDYLSICTVEEVEPFKVADSDTVYQRAFSENRDFWYLTMQGVSEISLDMNPAGQFEKEKITNSYFAFEPSSVRFNSTVLTGFMTGESKTENGRQLVEVSTVTG